MDGDVAACVDAGAPGVVGAAALFGLAAAGAHADADANASGFVCGVGVFHLRGAVWVLVAGGHLAFGITLSCLDRVCGLFEVEGGVGPSQQLHAATAGVACRLQLAAGRLQGRQHRAGDRHCQAALLELLFCALAAGLARFGDVYLLGGDGDVTFGGDDVTARLGEGPACVDGDVAACGAQRGGGCRGLLQTLIEALLLFADGEAQATTAEQARLLGFVEAGAALGVLRCFEVDVAHSAQVHGLVSQHVGAFDGEVLACGDAHAGTFEVAGHGGGAGGAGAGGGGFL